MGVSEGADETSWIGLHRNGWLSHGERLCQFGTRTPPIVSAVPRRSRIRLPAGTRRGAGGRGGDGVGVPCRVRVDVRGYVGVSVFFTLSGYLITSLALVEHERTGALDVRAFYGRRIRRLLPASVAVPRRRRRARRRRAVRRRRRPAPRRLGGDHSRSTTGSLLAGGRSYADLVAGVGDPRSPLDHYWSLAIEEQFYWVWPLALVGSCCLRRGRRLVAVACSVAAAARRGAADPRGLGRGRDVLGDTGATRRDPRRRADRGVLHRPALAAGAACRRALAGAGRTRGHRLGGVDVAGGSGPAYVGWLPVFALASGALIVGLQVDSPFRRILGVRPIVFVGVISYGIYLFHWPIYAVLDGQRTGLDDAALFALRVAVTLAVAVLSFYLLERPIRLARPLRGGRRPLRRWRVARSSSRSRPCCRPNSRRTGSAPATSSIASPWNRSTRSRRCAVVTTTPTPPPRSTTPPSSRPRSGPHRRAGAGPLLSRPVRVVVVGDSTASATGQGLSPGRRNIPTWRG